MSMLETNLSRLEIIQLLFETENERLLDDIRQALRKDVGSKDFYDDLTEKDKERIELSKQDIQDGKLLSNNEVMSNFKAKYQK